MHVSRHAIFLGYRTITSELIVTCAAIVLRNLWTIEFENSAYGKLKPVKEEIPNFSADARACEAKFACFGHNRAKEKGKERNGAIVRNGLKDIRAAAQVAGYFGTERDLKLLLRGKEGCPEWW